MATSVEQVTYNAPDGAVMGNAATEKIAFYGATPIVQPPDVTAASTYVVTGQSTATASTYGLNSAEAVTTMVAQISSLVAAMKALGLVA